jgi:tetratricopeptide (TPR) repeat protein
MAKTIIILAIFCISIINTHAQGPDWNFIERQVNIANSQYQAKIDQVKNCWNNLNSVKLINRYNYQRLEEYKKKLTESWSNTVKSIDLNSPSMPDYLCNKINYYLNDKPLKEEIDLLTDLYGEISRLKISNPESYTSSSRYKEILEIFNTLESCPIEDIYKLRWQKLPTKQRVSSVNNSNSLTAADYYKQAQEKYKLGDYPAALEAINKSISISTEYAGSYSFRGWVYIGLRNFEEAVRDFTTAIQMKPNDTFSYHFYQARGNAYSELNKNIEAMKDFTQVIKMKPDYLRTYFSRAHIKSELGDEIGAISDYDYLIKNYDGSNSQGYLIATVYNNKAYSLYKLHRYNEALPLANKAIEFGPNESYAWSTRGEIYYQLQQYRQCIESMDKALELQENKKSLASDHGDGNEKYYYRGMSKIKMGKKAEGCADLSKAGELGNSAAYEEIKKQCR